jgi:intein-encoded DNA endonuclease-like protein
MRASSNFKINKETKRVLATIIDPHQRGEYVRAMVDAQLSYEKAKRDAMRQKRNDGGSDE